MIRPPRRKRARAIALLAVAAPPLFVFLGVEVTRCTLQCPTFGYCASGILAQQRSRAEGGCRSPRRYAAHGISALGIISIILDLHLANHLTFILGPDTYRAVMKGVRHVYRQEVLQPLLVALFLFQVGSGVFLATHAVAQPTDRFRTFQIASGIFLAAYVLGHMNSVFVYARLHLGIDSDWAFATGAPAGLVKDAWNIRLVPHYGLGVVRSVILAHGLTWRFADRFLIGSAMASGLAAFVIMFGMCGARLNFVGP